MSCWSELHEELQNELVKHLEMALESQIPEITQTLLNLAEFMEHTEKVTDVLCVAALGIFSVHYSDTKTENCSTVRCHMQCRL